MTPNAPAYELTGVVQRYGQAEVLRVEGLAIPQGEIFALVGPSGSGKSTLLRLLNFLESPAEGSVSFWGKPFFSGDGQMPLEVRRQVTMVFQRPVLLKDSVYANVAYGLKARGERNCQQKVDEVLAQVGLEGFPKREASTLSGGEVQRVALARALVLKPQVLLLDEPTANLDPYNVGLIESIIESFNRQEGKTVVLVTHSVFQAKRLAHRVALLLEGKVAEVAEKERFFGSPSDPRTAAFVRGEMVY